MGACTLWPISKPQKCAILTGALILEPITKTYSSVRLVSKQQKLLQQSTQTLFVTQLVDIRNAAWNCCMHWRKYGSSEGGINKLRPRQNGRHCPDDIFKCIFLKMAPARPQAIIWTNDGFSSLTHICVTRSQWVKFVSLNWYEYRETYSA